MGWPGPPGASTRRKCDVYIAAECLKMTGDDQDSDSFTDCLYDITWVDAMGDGYTFGEEGRMVDLANAVVEPGFSFRKAHTAK